MLTAEQTAAVAARDRDVFCEAGAGTGKTRVLVNRFCDAVDDDAIPVSRILAFTFTDAAAAELRARIRAELRARATGAREGDDHERANALEEAARAAEDAWISTIHGFCRRLLANDPIAAGLPPRFRVLDDDEAERLAGRAVRAALDGLLAAGDAGVAALATAYGPGGLGLAVRSAHEGLRARGSGPAELPDPPALDPEASLRRLRPAARAALSALRDASRRPTADIERIGGALTAGQDPDALAACRPRGRSAALDCDEVRAYTTALDEAIAAAASARHAGAWAALGRLLAAFATGYQALKDERAALDFDDLQEHAVGLLESDRRSAARWAQRFDHVLVDEFQDTSPLQARLVDAIRAADARLFCVGDELQSIYGFRRADVGVFRERRAVAEADPESAVLPLSENFRSGPAILAAVNAIGGILFGAGYRPLRPASGDWPRPTGTVELHVTDAEGWEDDHLPLSATESPPATRAEATGCAARLRELVDSGEASAGDCVVLLRSFTHAAAFEEALERAGLDPVVIGGRGYWSAQQVEDVRAMLGAVANPLDDRALMALLASPAVGASPDTLWMLRRATGPGRPLWPTLDSAFGRARGTGDEEGEEDVEGADWLKRIAGEQAEALTDAVEAISSLRSEARRLPLETLVDRVVCRFDYDLAVLSLPAGRRRLANVRKLQRLAASYERTEGRDLRGFLDELAGRAERDREGQAAVHAEDHDGVRVMTIHASKGLEFPVVWVGALGRRLLVNRRGPVQIGRGDPPPVGLRLDRPGAGPVLLYDHRSLCEQADLADAEEELRLVHVAATRAERRLFLSGCHRLSALDRDESGAAGRSVLERILRPLGVTADASRGTLSSAPVDLVPIRPGDLPPALPPRRPSEGPAVPAGLPDPPEPAHAPPPLPAALTPSALLEHRRCPYRFAVERLVGIPSEAGRRTGGLAVGSAVHAMLEWSARNRWVEPSERVAESIGRSHGLEDAAPARELATAWLSSPLAERAAAALRARPEVPFAVDVAGVVLRGVIDLIVEDPDGTPLVIDYKTDALDGPGSVHRAAERYSLQRDAYAVALARGGARSVDTAWVFLAVGATASEASYGPDELARAESRLAERVELISAGRFEPTARPHIGLCGGCPARARLCPHPWERTGLPAPAAG